jgi:hypothetical protein
MKLLEIKQALDAGKQVRLDLLAPYAKLLHVIYKRKFGHEPMVMVLKHQYKARYCRVLNFHRYLELLYDLPRERAVQVHEASFHLKRLR